MTNWIDRGRQLHKQQEQLRQQQLLEEQKRLEAAEAASLEARVRAAEPLRQISEKVGVRKVLERINREVWGGLGSIATNVHPEVIKGSEGGNLPSHPSHTTRLEYSLEVQGQPTIPSPISSIAILVTQPHKSEFDYRSDTTYYVPEKGVYMLTIAARAYQGDEDRGYPSFKPIYIAPSPYPIGPGLYRGGWGGQIESSFLGGYKCPNLDDDLSQICFAMSENRGLPQHNRDFVKRWAPGAIGSSTSIWKKLFH